ncbi:MAG: GlsB/YeaQ/YmgE family stress response membrane protein [Planctomycetes bacterium]|nr:GlsB/YeaQ/YmgE family stress response membrane protein [Planctomycetota bacterium]
MNASQIVSFLLVGALAGSLVGALVMRKRSGFGFGLNLFVGLVGALIGGGLFSLLHINLGLLGKIEVNLEDLIAAFAGALILLLLLALMGKSPKKAKKG